MILGLVSGEDLLHQVTIGDLRGGTLQNDDFAATFQVNGDGRILGQVLCRQRDIIEGAELQGVVQPDAPDWASVRPSIVGRVVAIQ